MPAKKYLITIVGPTAIGKTTLSILLAKKYNAPILSCDSRQFFKEMHIGTAVPSEKELTAAEHHFIQHKSIFETYNVGMFEREALLKLDEIYKKNNIAILVGGSGLYVDALLKGLDYFPKVAASIREALNTQLKTKGISVLQQELKNLDLESYNTIAIENPQRLIRALEICIGTNKTYSSFKNKPKATRNFIPILIGLQAERATLYNRINTRVDTMFENGLHAEAKDLHKHKDLNALQTVGYKELFNYFEGNISLETAKAEIKKNTRRFAKRQGTWFRKNKDIQWFDFKEDTSKITAFIDSFIF